MNEKTEAFLCFVLASAAIIAIFVIAMYLAGGKL